jgi:hypothetical protein
MEPQRQACRTYRSACVRVDESMEEVTKDETKAGFYLHIWTIFHLLNKKIHLCYILIVYLKINRFRRYETNYKGE